jgi:tetratricopeptide (TPR) repeat protein
MLVSQVDTPEKEYKAALVKVEQVKKLLPGYTETYRIAAFLENLQGNLLGADEEYKRGFNIEPNNIKLNYFYAGFLMRKMDDPVEALPYAIKAWELSSHSPATAIQYATCLGYIGKLSEALSRLNDLWAQNIGLIAKHYRIIAATIIDFHRRLAETKRQTERDFRAAIQSCTEGLRVYAEAQQRRYCDMVTINKLADLMREYKKCLRFYTSADEQNCFNKYLSAFEADLRRSSQADFFSSDFDALRDPTLQSNGKPNILSGIIIERYPNRPYAFIQCNDGQRYYIYKTKMLKITDWDCIENGTLVTFRIGENQQGPCATDVNIFKI